MFMLEYIDLWMFFFVGVFLMLGYPVALTLGGVALLFALLGYCLDIFSWSYLLPYPQRIFGIMRNEVLISVPLFIFMGVILERSKVAEKLLVNMGKLFKTYPGGLGISVSLVGALLAASTGIVGATVVTMGLMSLPTMLKYKYDVRLATGSIAASGTLGQIIPPSIVLIILGDQISNSYQAARLSIGDFSPEPVSVGDLFAGALLPGLGLVFLYIVYQIGIAIFFPHKSPAVRNEVDDDRAKITDILFLLFPPIALIVSVLGSILMGLATPTEAAAVGAFGAILLAGAHVGKVVKASITASVCAISLMILSSLFDLRLSRDVIDPHDMLGIFLAFLACLGMLYGFVLCLIRCYYKDVLQSSLQASIKIITMVFTILIGASLFSLVFRGLGGEEHVHAFLSNLPGGAFGAMLVVMGVIFVLGFFLDFLEIVFVVVPIVSPVLFKLGLDPVWVAIMIAINLQTSFLTPPFGFALFYLRGIAPPEVKTLDIYYGIIPFVCIQIIMLCILWVFPELATWLPKVLLN